MLIALGVIIQRPFQSLIGRLQTPSLMNEMPALLFQSLIGRLQTRPA